MNRDSLNVIDVPPALMFRRCTRGECYTSVPRGNTPDITGLKWLGMNWLLAVWKCSASPLIARNLSKSRLFETWQPNCDPVSVNQPQERTLLQRQTPARASINPWVSRPNQQRQRRFAASRSRSKLESMPVTEGSRLTRHHTNTL